jgi:Phosphoesterase family
MNDQLPTVSWILAPSDFDEHPAHLPAAGATYVAGKIDAIAANPEVWAKTVFIVVFDEHGGFFDHVVPPIPVRGQADRPARHARHHRRHVPIRIRGRQPARADGAGRQPSATGPGPRPPTRHPARQPRLDRSGPA